MAAVNIEAIARTGTDQVITVATTGLGALLEMLESVVQLTQAGATGITTASGKTAEAWIEELQKFIDVVDTEAREIRDAAIKVLPS